MRPALLGLLALLTGSALIGWLIDAPALCLALGWLLYGLVQLWQLARLQRWLEQPSMQTLPHARRLWGDLFDTLHRLLRREQKERERFGRIIERIETATAALQDALLILDGFGHLTWWNAAAESLLGLKSRQDSGQLLCNLVRHPDFRAWLMSIDAQDALTLPSPLDEKRYLQFHKTQYGNGETLLLVRDVTRMQHLEQMRKDFVDNLSHELRTPLTVISGYLEILQNGSDARLPARIQKALIQMQNQAQRMQRLLKDLLLLAELEDSEPVATEPVDVAALLNSIVTDTRVLADARGLRIRLEAHPALQLFGSAEELRSAFANLIFNAVKYSPDGGEIHIRWWGDKQGAHFAVQDQGDGIEEKHLSRLTERFYRVDKSRQSGSGGSGLGLAIVKHVLLRHGGQLHIQSKPGQGSTFSCHFALFTLSPNP